jgi:hypothetical protein
MFVFTLLTCQKVSDEKANSFEGKWYFNVDINSKNGSDRTSTYHGEMFKLSHDYLIQYGIDSYKKVKIRNNILYDLSNQYLGEIDSNTCEFKFVEEDYTVTILGHK